MKILVAYSMSSTYVNTTRDYLYSYRLIPNADVSYLHVTHNARIQVDLNDYDVIIHNYCARICFKDFVSTDYLAALRLFDGVKILSVQDEYNETDYLKQMILDLGFAAVLTCVPDQHREFVYPQQDFPHIRFINVLTGYVSDDLIARLPRPLPLEQRPVTIGYRGRDIGGLYGVLGHDKAQIGIRMKMICESAGVRHDIAIDEQSRIYGNEWYSFLGRCRMMLGTQSGSNIFDFDGSLQQQFRTMEKESGYPPTYEEFLPFTVNRETLIDMGQISPRIFEYAMMRTVMVLFPGHYSGVIEPGVHYIPLERDFSNIEEIFSRMEDWQTLHKMTDRAYNDLIASGRYSYQQFADLLGNLISEILKDGQSPKSSTIPRPIADNTVENLPENEIFQEFPTTNPLTKDCFDLRLLNQQINCFASEVHRVAKTYKKFCTDILDELHRLQEWADTLYNGRCSNGTTVSQPVPCPPDSSAVINAFNTYIKENQEFISQFETDLVFAELFPSEQSRKLLEEICERLKNQITVIWERYNLLVEEYYAWKKQILEYCQTLPEATLLNNL